ncbi:MAG: YbaN family protein [Gammaproteobacteria bacterium]|nr:YbaN family protein [Gammaproteobacteria bacterium]
MNENGATRPLWLAVGVVSLGCGAAGAVLPLLPTTPFVLLSAYAFARSSPSLHRWLIRHPHFGPLIRNWQLYGAIDRRTKFIAVAIMVLTPFITWLIGAPPWALAAQCVVLAGAATFVLTRPDGG